MGEPIAGAASIVAQMEGASVSSDVGMAAMGGGPAGNLHRDGVGSLPRHARPGLVSARTDRGVASYLAGRRSHDRTRGLVHGGLGLPSRESREIHVQLWFGRGPRTRDSVEIGPYQSDDAVMR